MILPQVSALENVYPKTTKVKAIYFNLPFVSLTANIVTYLTMAQFKNRKMGC